MNTFLRSVSLIASIGAVLSSQKTILAQRDQPSPRPPVIQFKTVADMKAHEDQLFDDQVVATSGYTTEGDGGGNLYVYRATGESGITPDGGFYIAGTNGDDLSDDYFEAKERFNVEAPVFGAIPTPNLPGRLWSWQSAVNVAGAATTTSAINNALGVLYQRGGGCLKMREGLFATSQLNVPHATLLMGQFDNIGTCIRRAEGYGENPSTPTAFITTKDYLKYMGTNAKFQTHNVSAYTESTAVEVNDVFTFTQSDGSSRVHDNSYLWVIDHVDLNQTQTVNFDYTTDLFSKAGSGLADGDEVYFETTGSWANFSNGTIYYVYNFTSGGTDTWQLASHPLGPAIEESSDPGGTHELTSPFYAVNSDTDASTAQVSTSFSGSPVTGIDPDADYDIYHRPPNYVPVCATLRNLTILGKQCEQDDVWAEQGSPGYGEGSTPTTCDGIHLVSTAAEVSNCVVSQFDGTLVVLERGRHPKGGAAELNDPREEFRIQNLTCKKGLNGVRIEGGGDAEVDHYIAAAIRGVALDVNAGSANISNVHLYGVGTGIAFGGYGDALGPSFGEKLEVETFAQIGLHFLDADRSKVTGAKIFADQGSWTEGEYPTYSVSDVPGLPDNEGNLTLNLNVSGNVDEWDYSGDPGIIIEENQILQWTGSTDFTASTNYYAVNVDRLNRTFQVANSPNGAARQDLSDSSGVTVKVFPLGVAVRTEPGNSTLIYDSWIRKDATDGFAYEIWHSGCEATGYLQIETPGDGEGAGGDGLDVWGTDHYLDWRIVCTGDSTGAGRDVFYLGRMGNVPERVEVNIKMEGSNAEDDIWIKGNIVDCTLAIYGSAVTVHFSAQQATILAGGNILDFGPNVTTVYGSSHP